MLNPNERLFAEKLRDGIARLGELKGGAAEIIIDSIADALQTEGNEDRPIFSSELAIDDRRFVGFCVDTAKAGSGGGKIEECDNA